MATEHSGEDKTARLRVGVIAGSARPGRQSRTVAEWACADPVPSLDLRLIDLADSGLLLLSEPAPAAFGQYRQPSARYSAGEEAADPVERLIPGFEDGRQPRLCRYL